MLKRRAHRFSDIDFDNALTFVIVVIFVIAIFLIFIPAGRTILHNPDPPPAPEFIDSPKP